MVNLRKEGVELIFDLDKFCIAIPGKIVAVLNGEA